MNEYNIIREVGRGGMGCVYEAISPNGGRVALKMMSAKAASDPDYNEMFYQEVQSLRMLSHPSIVGIVGAPFSDGEGNLYLPMEFVDGKTISQVVKEQGPYSEDEAVRIFGQILDVFTYIHKKGCIHRDVKPSNIMIRPSGDICVIDFGIAKDSKTSTGKTIGRIVGTDGYMSPEQANGYNIDHRTDIYSLGCLFHYMLTGSHAIQKKSNDYETVCAILEDKFPTVAEKGYKVADKTQQAILKAVDKNMMHRYQTTDKFKEGLTGERTKGNSVSVGRSGCDINIPAQYVSGRHLDIEWTYVTGPSSIITITDHSTNGTGINGRKIHNDSYKFDTNKSIQELLNDKSSLPQVFIAGLADYELDWDKVLNILFEKMDMKTTVYNDDVHRFPLESETTTGTRGKTQTDENLGMGYGILAVFFPIVGWILGGVWKTEHPQKAKKAARLGWIGFIINLILYLIGYAIY